MLIEYSNLGVLCALVLNYTKGLFKCDGWSKCYGDMWVTRENLYIKQASMYHCPNSWESTLDQTWVWTGAAFTGHTMHQNMPPLLINNIGVDKSILEGVQLKVKTCTDLREFQHTVRSSIASLCWSNDVYTSSIVAPYSTNISNIMDI